MPEVETQLRDYFESMVERISAEDILAERRVLRTTTRPARREWSLRPAWAAVAGFVGTILVLGGWLWLGSLLEGIDTEAGSGAVTETLTETGEGVSGWWLVVAAVAVTIGVTAALVADYRLRRGKKEGPMKATTEGDSTERTTSARRSAMQTQEKQEIQSRPGRVWWIVGLSVLVVGLIGVGIWAIVAANQPDDIDIATDLVDEWNAAWVADDPDVVDSVFTEEGTYIDENGTHSGRAEIRDHVYAYASGVTAAERTGELTMTRAGTFTFPMYGDVPQSDGEVARYSIVVEIELDGDLASRIEWLEWDIAALE